MRDIRYIFLSIFTLSLLVLSSFTLNHSAENTPPPPGGGGGLVNYDTIDLVLSNCALQGSMCLPIKLSDALKLRITDNGQPLPVDIMNGCAFDTTSAYTYSNLFEFGPYVLTSWQVNGQVFSDTFQDIPELVGLMNTWDPMGNWVQNPANQLISGGNSANTYDTMQVWVTLLQSPSYIGYNIGVTPTGTELSFTRGFHQVILADTINNMADTFYVHAYCSETINQTIPTGMSATNCMTTTDLIDGLQSVSFCSDPTNTAVQFNLDPVGLCVTYTALQPGTASACVIMCDSTGFCDTTFFNINVIEPNTVHQVNLQLISGQVAAYCFDSTNTLGNVVSMTPCGSSQNGFATYALDTATNCMQVTGLVEGGTDYACVVVCNDLGNCDTTYFTTIVRRVGPDVVHDTVFLNQSGNYCVDQYQLDSINAFVSFIQPDSGFMTYSLIDSSFCVNFTGTSLGTDTLGMQITNTGGQADTTYLILTVIPPAPQTIIDTIEQGESTMYCLPLNELFGNIYTVTNLCPLNQNGDVGFDVDTLTLCVEYTGQQPGTDSLCLRVCDNLGGCDTFVFIITALDTLANLLPPVASDDASLTDVNTPVTFSVLLNDLMPGAQVGDIMVLPVTSTGGATLGSVLVDTATNMVIYTPPTDLCDTTDSFTYIVCNVAGCDTAIATVMILCDDNPALGFYQGFSPNGDNINDMFVIKNADKFPGNELSIFNRWGNRVFYDRNYRNNWDGTWQDKPLPDGVYFYIFDDGKGQKHSDCLHIRR
jgi:gliding motility-associated-like protein